MEVMAFTGFNKSMSWVRHFVEHMGVVVVKISSSVLRVAGAGVGGGAAVVAGSGMVGAAVDSPGAAGEADDTREKVNEGADPSITSTRECSSWL